MIVCKFFMYLSSNLSKIHQYLSNLSLLTVFQLHVIQNAKMGESASDLENADVHLGMGVDTVIKVRPEEEVAWKDKEFENRLN